ncbi:hypothetical protein ACS0TY_005907 [Phlomoides rotata]
MEIIQLADKELMSFIGFVERLDSRSRKRMKASLEGNAEAIREYERVFELHFSKLWDKWSNKINNDGDRFSIALEDLKRDTELLVETLKNTKEEEDPEDDDEAAVGNKMVGSRDQYSKLKQQIVCGDNHITSLVGMAGIGKTTLAREIFKDLDVVEFFVSRAWVTIGEEFKSEEIIESILAQVDPHVHEMAKGGNERMLVEYLKKSLEGKLTLGN